ncbi:MAG: hypothetical protein WCP57_04470 [Bacteroidota bacterium]
MYKSKLIQVFSKLSSKDQLLIKSYLRDISFNTHNKVIELYDFIYEHKESIHNIDKKTVYHYLFKKDNYNDLALRHLMSYLIKLIEQFGIIRYNEKSSFEEYHEEMRFYSSIEYEKGIEETISRYQKELQKNKVLNTEEIYTKYLVDTFIYNHSIKQKRTDIVQLSELNKSLDEFFILSKLKVACNIINQQNIFNLTIDSGFFKDLMEYVGKLYLSNKMISLYYHIYKLISTNDDKIYKFCVENLEECLTIRKKNDLKDALVLLINFCIKKINQGDITYEIAVFNHYKIGIDNTILIEKEMLSPFTYSNALNIAIKLNDLKWAEEMLEKYKDHLDTEYPHDYYSLNKAKVLLAYKKFNEALDFVNKTEINDILTQLQLRIVQLKIFIELDEYRLAESYIANFKQLLKRKGIINYHKTNFNKIASYMLKLINLAPYSKAGKIKLIKAIQMEPVLSEKSWLLEKLNN